MRFAIIFLVMTVLIGNGCSSGNGMRSKVAPAEAISSKSMKEKIKVGGLYSINSGEGDFGVVKVLAADDDVVHIRLYKNKFMDRPVTVNTSELSLGSINDKDGFGMGHLPLSAASFGQWEPAFISEAPVTYEELEGYRMWKDAGGGVWN